MNIFESHSFKAKTNLCTRYIYRKKTIQFWPTLVHALYHCLITWQQPKLHSPVLRLKKVSASIPSTQTIFCSSRKTCFHVLHLIDSIVVMRASESGRDFGAKRVNNPELFAIQCSLCSLIINQICDNNNNRVNKFVSEL